MSYNIFVSEYLTCGACSDRLAPSLVAEGLGMLTALIDDLVQADPHLRIIATWNESLGLVPITHSQLEWVLIPTPLDFEAKQDEALKRATHAWFIAPEFLGLLERQVTVLNQHAHCRSLNCLPDAIRLTTDKWQLASYLQQQLIPTIPTKLYSSQSPPSVPYPVVIKPRDGAGSQATFLISDAADWNCICRDHAGELVEWELIQQPYIAGRALSIAAMVAPESTTPTFLPLCEQVLSLDGRFQYSHSKVIESESTTSPQLIRAAQQLVTRCLSALPGLRGYVGFDLIEPSDHPGEVILVEVNPRLTSSYLAYRQVLPVVDLLRQALLPQLHS